MSPKESLYVDFDNIFRHQNPTKFETEMVQKEAGRIGMEFAGLYKKFLPQEKVERLSSLNERVFVLHKTDFKVFEELGGGGMLYGKLSLYEPQRGIIVINKDYMNAISKVTKSRNIKIDEVETYRSMIALETARSMGDRMLPHEFAESGSSYYAYEVLSLLQQRVVFPDSNIKKVWVYEKMLRQRGENVHWDFFGKDSNVDLS